MPQKKRRSGSQRQKALSKMKINRAMSDAERAQAFELIKKKKFPDFVKEALRRSFGKKKSASRIFFNSMVRGLDQILTSTGIPRSLEAYIKLEKKVVGEPMSEKERMEEEKKLSEQTFLTDTDRAQIKEFWDAHPKLTWTQAHRVNHYFVVMRWYNRLLDRRKIKPPTAEKKD
jgi:hypothetical protein